VSGASARSAPARSPLHLRPARESDAYALWLWANDPTTRDASFGRGEIAWDSHVDWFGARLQDAGTLIAVAEAAHGRPVGTVRFETSDRWASARLSYLVAPEARGGGLGRAIAEAGVRWVVAAHPAVRITADVAAANERSLRIFRGMGWREERTPAGALIFIRDPAP